MGDTQANLTFAQLSVGEQFIFITGPAVTLVPLHGAVFRKCGEAQADAGSGGEIRLRGPIVVGPETRVARWLDGFVMRGEAEKLVEAKVSQVLPMASVAPELLAAIKAILEVPEAVKALVNWGDAALIAARSAVAKAEGR